MEYVIETENLTKIYGKGKEAVKALDNVSLKVPKGSICGLLGHNGAGKTTLISLLVGLTLPTSGSGKVLGYDIIKESINIRKKVGLLPEGFGFYDDMSALENLIYLGQLDGLSLKDATLKAKENLEKVGLSNEMNKKVAAFSRGMKQRLGIAQALLKNPELLILDEPTVGIDPYGAKGFRDLIISLSKEGITTMVSTHLLHEVGMICDYAIILKRGKLLDYGSLKEMTQKVIDKVGVTYEISIKGDIIDLMEKIKSIEGVRKAYVEDNKLIINISFDKRERILQFLREKEIVFEYFNERPISWEAIFMEIHGGI
ncbi:MAG: ABC transporter ATP-binding protein [Candidatus Aenigmatarchaeota archaeon]